MKKGIAEVPGITCGSGFGGIIKDRPDTLVIVTDEPSNFAAVLILKKKWNTYNNVLDFSHCVAIAK